MTVNVYRPEEDENRMNPEQIQALATSQPKKVPWEDFRLFLMGSAALLLLILLSGWLWFLLPLRLVLALIYILYVPGYCLTALLFPRHEDLDGIERLGLSLGLSIVWVSVLALLLDVLPWGLRLWPILLGELLSSALFGAAAVWQRARMPAGEAFAPELTWQPGKWWGGLPWGDRRSYQLIFAALVLTALALAWTFLVPTPDEFMTEFYMLGAGGLAEDFPREAGVGEDIGVTLGVVNLERGPYLYRVEVWAVDPWAEGHRQMVGAPEYTWLDKGDSREWPVSWQIPWAGDDQMVELLLFKGEESTSYRRLVLWMNVLDP
jgi:uncharacterized membrane protein